MLVRVNYAELLLPDFSLILLGYLLCRFTALNRSLWSQLERLVYFFLFPLLLFHTIVKNPLDLNATSSLMAAGLTLGIAAIGLSYSLRWWPLLGRYCDARLHAASAQVGFRFIMALGLSLLFRLAPTQASVLLMFSAVPTASSCYVLAARMGYNGPYVAGLVTLSTLLGLLSLPFAWVVLQPLLR
ncbi:MAG: hypothetical protein RLZZ352_1006 [Pseudomonadota bacterium]|jgi:predicted permease